MAEVAADDNDELVQAFELYQQRVEEAETVVDVKMIYVRYISDMNSVEQTYEIAVDFDLEWPATEDDAGEWQRRNKDNKYVPSRVPGLAFPNAKKCNQKRGVYPDMNTFKVKENEDGLLVNCMRVLVEATALACYNLRSFPFDVQSLPLIMEFTFTNKDQMIFRGVDQPLFVWNTFFSASADFSFRRALIEFWLRDDDYSAIVLRFQVQRKYAGYMWRIAWPLTMLFAVSWLGFTFETEEPSSTTANYLATVVLAFIAFSLVVSQQQPQVPYLTFLDLYIYTCFTAVGFVLIASGLFEVFAEPDKMRIKEFKCAYGILICVVILSFALVSCVVLCREKKKLKKNNQQLRKMDSSRRTITVGVEDLLEDSHHIGVIEPFVSMGSAIST